MGIGIGPTAIDSVIGVVKAYTTRVGNGPLPSAFDPDMDERIRALGTEFGATTGRPRRCGWFDAVLAAYSARVNGLTGIAVTKLDVLDTLPELKIATGYRIDGDTRSLFPACVRELERAEPVYETLPGWQSPTTGARAMGDLPSNARGYLDRIEEPGRRPHRDGLGGNEAEPGGPGGMRGGVWTSPRSRTMLTSLVRQLPGGWLRVPFLPSDSSRAGARVGDSGRTDLDCFPRLGCLGGMPCR